MLLKAAKFVTILHSALQWQWQNKSQTLDSQKTPHTSPSRASYGVTFFKDFGENWPRYNGTALNQDSGQYYDYRCTGATGNSASWQLNTLRPRQNGCHFPDDIFKWIFVNEIIWISIKISLKFVTGGRIDNIPALVKIMAWRRPGEKLLSEPMMVSSLRHICVTRPQWVNAWQWYHQCISNKDTTVLYWAIVANLWSHIVCLLQNYHTTEIS